MTQTIDITMNAEMADEIENRAAEMHLSAGNYIALILQDWIENNESELLLQEK